MATPRLSRWESPNVTGPAPVFILNEPQMGENIGAAARAMLNFGLMELRLAAPRDGWPSEKAEAMASGALEVMAPVAVYDDLAGALADCQFVAATTARSREVLLPVMTPEQVMAACRARTDAGERCAIVFGGERAGLSNEDVQRANCIVSIPVNPAFASLNLAQAVTLLGYEWARASERAIDPGDLERVTPATRADFDRLIDHLFSSLDAAHYFHPPERRHVKERNLKASLLRAGLSEGEVRAWRGVIKALVQYQHDHADGVDEGN